MIKIALCDDEAKILDEVSEYIGRYAQRRNESCPNISRFDSVRALLNALDDEKEFDIFVLDIYIGNELGTELAKKIRKRGIASPIIFLTTSLEHAPQGYEIGTLRYLIKPLDPEKLYEALDAALLQVDRISEQVIKFKTENGIESVNAGQIICTEAHAHYQHIILTDGSMIRIRMTVAELYDKLVKYGGFAVTNDI